MKTIARILSLAGAIALGGCLPLSGAIRHIPERFGDADADVATRIALWPRCAIRRTAKNDRASRALGRKTTCDDRAKAVRQNRHARRDTIRRQCRDGIF